RGRRRGTAAGGVDGDVVDEHRHAGRRRPGRVTRPAAAHGDVEDDEEPVRGGVGPGGGVDLVLAHLVVLLAVDVPADLLRRDAAVPLDSVRVERRLAGRARAGAVAADAGRLVARAARAYSTVERAPDGVGPVDVLHDVDLADARPVGVDA